MKSKKEFRILTVHLQFFLTRHSCMMITLIPFTRIYQKKLKGRRTLSSCTWRPLIIHQCCFLRKNSLSFTFSFRTCENRGFLYLSFVSTSSKSVLFMILHFGSTVGKNKQTKGSRSRLLTSDTQLSRSLYKNIYFETNIEQLPTKVRCYRLKDPVLRILWLIDWEMSFKHLETRLYSFRGFYDWSSMI